MRLIETSAFVCAGAVSVGRWEDLIKQGVEFRFVLAGSIGRLEDLIRESW